MTRHEFLVRVRTTVPADVSAEDWSAVVAAERRRGAELRRDGVIAHIWRVPSDEAVENIGVWRADDRDAVQTAIDSLPARPWMQVEVTLLEEHPLTAIPLDA